MPYIHVCLSSLQDDEPKNAVKLVYCPECVWQVIGGSMKNIPPNHLLSRNLQKS